MMIYDTVNLPTYALAYLIYGDGSGLSPHDIKIIDRWIDHYSDIEGQFHLSPHSDEYFSSVPAFGLPTTCVDCDIVISECHGNVYTISCGMSGYLPNDSYTFVGSLSDAVESAIESYLIDWENDYDEDYVRAELLEYSECECAPESAEIIRIEPLI